MSNDASSPTESGVPQRIGSGSFATIFVVRGQSYVFKQTQFEQRTGELKSEFIILHTLYKNCNSDSVFAIPRAIAFHDPASGEFLSFPASPPFGRIRDPRPSIGPSFFASLSSTSNVVRASYAMDRAHVLPTVIGNLVCQNFYAEQHRTTVVAPYLCRLYFGKELASRGSRFVNPVNFPIDRARYEILYEKAAGHLLPIQEVVEGMGEMLARIHWRAGLDGRDIEFVMGGSGYHTVRYYVIDFNQTKPFDKQSSDLSVLVDSFFTNDPYYPRPRPTDDLYIIFKNAYLTACPRNWRIRGEEFLRAIETKHAQREIESDRQATDSPNNVWDQ